MNSATPQSKHTTTRGYNKMRGLSIAVLDLEMPGLSRIEVTKQLMEHPPGLAAVICSLHRHEHSVRAALEAGALGYVLKPDCVRSLVLAVQTVARGQTFFPIGQLKVAVK
jgi:DNA-binding NarL/FixJ family response regulator